MESIIEKEKFIQYKVSLSSTSIELNKMINNMRNSMPPHIHITLPNKLTLPVYTVLIFIPRIICKMNWATRHNINAYASAEGSSIKSMIMLHPVPIQIAAISH